MTDKLISDLTNVTYTDLLGTTELPIQRAASSSAEAMTLDNLTTWITGVPAFIAGNWYPTVRSSLGAGSALANGTAKFHPFFLPRRVTISDIGTRGTTAGGAGNNVQFAIYAANLSTGRPTGSELGKTASISTNGVTGQVSAALAGGNITLLPGIYFFGVNSDNTTNVMQVNAATMNFTSLFGSATFTNLASAAAVVNLHVSTSLTFGTWGDLTSASWTEATTTAYALGYFKAA